MNTVTQWKLTSVDLADGFRLGQDVETSQEMVTFVSSLVANFPQEHARQLHPLLASMLNCQERQDWLGLADYLEYELCQLLDSLTY